MSLFKNIFGPKDEPIQNYQDFWGWFQKNEKAFFQAVKKRIHIEKDFFDKIDPKLQEIKDGFFYLTGMYDDHTVELVLTADGNVKNIVFVEELVEAAPQIPGWKFTALKPSIDIEHVHIMMEGYEFNSQNLFFYAHEYSEYPDEIDIVVVYTDYKEEDKKTIINGVYIFLDNYLGELNSVSTIDNLDVIAKHEAEKELIPIYKLKDFLIWRQKEFIEKYDDVLQETEKANYAVMTADLKNGNKLLATINRDLLDWEYKASHPWIMLIEINYENITSPNQGMPDSQANDLLNEIEDAILKDLNDYEGHLHIGRQTAENVREIYFACKDFRKPSKVMHHIILKFASQVEITYDIYKDKYWQSLDRFKPHYS